MFSQSLQQYRLAALRTFLKRVVCVFVCLSLVLNCFLEPRRKAYAVVSEIVAGLTLSGFVTEVVIPSLAIAYLGWEVTHISDSDLEIMANEFIGNDAVPANREFAENAYSQYQANGSVILNASDVPNSAVNTIVEGAQPYLSEASLPFPLSFALQDANLQTLVDSVSSVTAPSWATLSSPHYVIWRGSSGSTYYYVFSVFVWASDASNPLRVSFGVNSSGYPSYSAFGKGRFNVAVPNASTNSDTAFAVVSYGSNSGSYSVAHRSGQGYSSTFYGAYPSADTLSRDSYQLFSRYGSHFSLLSDSTLGFDLSPAVVSSTPSDVAAITQGLASGTLSAGQAVTDIQAQLANQQIALNSVISSYTDIVGAIEGGSGEISGGIDTANGYLADILTALGVAGPIASGIAGLASAFSSLPATLSGLLFNTSVRSFGSEAVSSLDGLFTQYVASIPTWLSQNVVPGIQAIPAAITLLREGTLADIILNQSDILSRLSGIPAEIPQAFGNVITGIPAQVWGLFDGPIGDIITGVDAVSDGIIGLPAALGDITLSVDLAGVLSAIGAIPASIASALGLDWVITGTEELKDRLELDSEPSFVLPTATWAEVTACATDFGNLTPLPYMERCINIVFDTFAGNGNSSAPRYEIVFPNPWGDDWVFVVDFSLFDGRFVTISHGLFYVSFAIWYWGFLKRIKAHWDDILQSVYSHPVTG